MTDRSNIQHSGGFDLALIGKVSKDTQERFLKDLESADGDASGEEND